MRTQDTSYDDLPTASTSTSAQQQRKRRSVTDAVDWAADKVPLLGASNSSGGGGGGRRPNAGVDQGAYLALGTHQPRAEITANRHDTAKILARLQVAFAALPDSTSLTSGAPSRGNSNGFQENAFSSSGRGMPQLNETWNDEDDDDDGGSSIGALTIDSSLREVDGGKFNNRGGDGGGGRRIGGGNAPAKGQPQSQKKARESPANHNNDQPEAAALPMPGEAQMASEWQNATVVARDTLAGACPHVLAVAEAATGGGGGGGGRSTVQPMPDTGEGAAYEGNVQAAAAAAAALAAEVLPSLNPHAWQAQSEAYARASFTSKHLDLCAAALTDQVGWFS